MFTLKPRNLPDHPDYKAACRQTVTLYNVYKDSGVQKYHKTVFEKCAYLESRRVIQDSKTGISATNTALLVIPIDAGGYQYVDPVIFDSLADKTGYWTIRANDKVCHDEGADITTAKDWAAFTNANHPGVVLIEKVDLKRNLAGQLVHVEAGE